MAEADHTPTPDKLAAFLSRSGRLFGWEGDARAAMRGSAERRNSRWIYVATFWDDVDCPTKIGISSQPHQRCRRQLLQLYQCFEAPDGGTAFDLEQEIHEAIFNHCLRRGRLWAPDGAEVHMIPRSVAARYVRMKLRRLNSQGKSTCVGPEII